MELNLQKISNKKFKFRWDDPMYSTLVEIVVPDLTKLDYSVGGDWGPQYTFKLIEGESISIRYNEKQFDGIQKLLHITAPMIAAEREIYPFFLKIEDSAREIIFQLYLNAEHELGKVEVIRSKERVKLYGLNSDSYIQGAL